ncbi:MAG TPA: hypothetical protein VFV70_01125, partial [Hyphomonadaceae bacterium]|nr:hypothetical protein [Hyphomonadaceae bacterium]
PAGTITPAKRHSGTPAATADTTPDYPILHFPPSFNEQAEQEAQTRGFLAGAEVELADGSRHGVHFTNASRLAYDLDEEARQGRPFVARKGLIVLQSLSRATMTNAVRALAYTDFFNA